jgi:glycosyltransferase involved in cell wall biosynthesis
MNILELCLSPSFGGLEIYMKDFSTWLSKKPGCTVYTGTLKESRIHHALKPLKLPTVFFKKPPGKLPVFRGARLARFIEDNNIDVVHVHWKYDLLLTAIAKHLSKKDFIFVHTRQMSLPDRKHNPYHKFIYSSLDCFIAITKHIEQQANQNLPIKKDKIKQIYYGIDTPQLPSDKRIAELKRKYKIDRKFNVALFGRITEFKGQHLLIEAIEMLNKENMVIKAMIVGDAFDKAYFQKLQKMVAEKHLVGQVSFLDFCPNPIELMCCFDAIVLTTKRETFGLVLIEGMYAGIPVIGSNAHGVPEIIDHMKTGLLFESWNPNSLAKQVKKLYLDPELRKNLASGGQRKVAQKFNRNKQYEKVLNLMKNLK